MDCAPRHLVSIHFMSSSLGTTAFVIFGVASVLTLKELNVQVTEPYMVRRSLYNCFFL